MTWLRSLNTYYKRPNEVVWIDVELSNQLATGESLTGTPTVTPPSGSDLTCDNISIVTTKVRFRINGGTAREQAYCVVVSVNKTGGAGAATIERECSVVVSECGDE